MSQIESWKVTSGGWSSTTAAAGAGGNWSGGGILMSQVFTNITKIQLHIDCKTNISGAPTITLQIDTYDDVPGYVQADDTVDIVVDTDEPIFISKIVTCKAVRVQFTTSDSQTGTIYWRLFTSRF